MRDNKKPCAVFDIDGVLTKNSTYRHDWPYIQKDAYFESDTPIFQELADGAKRLLYDLQRDGWCIVLVTARPVCRYPKLAWMTYDWLYRHELPFTDILFGEDKLLAIGESGWEPSFIVEDDFAQAYHLSRGGMKVYLLGLVDTMDLPRKPWSETRIRFVRDLEDVRKAILDGSWGN